MNKDIKILENIMYCRDGTTWLPALTKEERKSILNAIKAIKKVKKLEREKFNTLQKIDKIKQIIKESKS